MADTLQYESLRGDIGDIRLAIPQLEKYFGKFQFVLFCSKRKGETGHTRVLLTSSDVHRLLSVSNGFPHENSSDF